MTIKLFDTTVTGTPEETYELLMLLGMSATRKPVKTEQKAVKTEQKAVKTEQKKPVDWAKAKALREAGWSYEKIGDELGVTGVTVAAHLKEGSNG